MARIPDDFLDALLARTDIVELIGARIPLKRQGREYSARCPFHDERSPSFTVSPTKQFYHCFGCGAHGSAIKFLMDYDRLEFLDAVEELARHAGMEVPREARQQQNPEIQPLYAALAAAAGFFRQQLAGNSRAEAYLDGRGIRAEVREQFQVGYAPAGYSTLKDTLGGDAARRRLLERAGLLSSREDGHAWDKFRDRIIFPIHDRRGRPIAFGGRVINPDDSPKYLNSPETALFHKGRELYGLWQARQAHSQLTRLLVVEGYMDVIALFQHGFDYAVATLGTATTPEHAELLFRNAADVVFCFDGDNAGRKAAWRALDAVLPRMRDGRQALFLFLPEGEDPDSLVQREGHAAFEQRLTEAKPLSEVFFEHMAADVNLATLDGKARLAERCKPLLAKIPDGAFADLMQQRLRELTGIGTTRAAGSAASGTPRTASRHAPSARPSLVRQAIALLLQRPDIAAGLDADSLPAADALPGLDLLHALVARVQARPEISTAALLEEFHEHAHAAALERLAMHTLPGDAETWRTEFLDAIEQLARQALQSRIEALADKQRHSGLDAFERDELRALLQQRADG